MVWDSGLFPRPCSDHIHKFLDMNQLFSSSQMLCASTLRIHSAVRHSNRLLYLPEHLVQTLSKLTHYANPRCSRDEPQTEEGGWEKKNHKVQISLKVLKEFLSHNGTLAKYSWHQNLSQQQKAWMAWGRRCHTWVARSSSLIARMIQSNNLCWTTTRACWWSVQNLPSGSCSADPRKG